jgi:hypothetical protein
VSLRSVPPERMLRALLLQVMFTIRSERQLMEQLDYNLMYRWFVGLGMDDDVWSPTVFIKNRERLFNGDIAEHFFDEVLVTPPIFLYHVKQTIAVLEIAERIPKVRFFPAIHAV